MLVLGVWSANQPVYRRATPHGSDVFLFRVVVDRMKSGEGYYDAMRYELVRRGYPTASIFNWRPPATFKALAVSPMAVHTVMLGLAGLAMTLTVVLFRDAPPGLTVLAVGMQLGSSVFPAIPTDGLYMPEAWAGIFLLLAVLGHSLGAFRFAICCAVLAACARELVLPFVFAGLAFAIHARRWDQVRWYVGGLAAFSAYYLVHVYLAIAHMQPGDMLHKGSWIAFGGWRFVVRTVAMGGWYLMFPRWVAAIGVVVVLASLWGPADRHLKAMVIIYLAGFCIVGQNFNDYWGLMTGPVWGLATVYGVIGLDRLTRAARGSGASPVPV